MKGFIRNEGNEAYFVMQRQVPPGGKVQISDAYISLGKKSGLEEGLEFVKWLQTNILTRGSWKVYKEEDKLLIEEKKTAKRKREPSGKKEVVGKTSTNRDGDARGAGRVLRRDLNSEATKGVEITPASIVETPYEQARVLIDKTRDKPTLRKALNLTQHFSGKEEHMRHLMRRLTQV